MTAFWIVISLIFALVGFFITYLLTYLIIKTLFVLVSAVAKKQVLPKAQPGILGFIAGLIAIYVTMIILLFIQGYAAIDENWYLIVIIFVIFYGQIQYFGQNFYAVSRETFKTVGWPGRLNYAVSSIIERSQFEYYRMFLQQVSPEQVGTEGDPIGHESYKRVKKYMFNVSMMTLVGIIAGLILYWYVKRSDN